MGDTVHSYSSADCRGEIYLIQLRQLLTERDIDSPSYNRIALSL
jgi:hypothetical protein